MKLTFSSLEYFQKVAELEHMTRAAKALHIAQPALSRTIQNLENELDVKLFDRQGRSIRLTRDGHILLKHADNFLKEYAEMQQEFKDSRDLQQMTVRLFIQTATKLIPSFLKEFKREHPEAIVELVNPNLAAQANEPDLFLYSSTNHIEKENSIMLFRESLVMVLPKTNRHARLPYINLADFSAMKYIAPPRGFVLRDTLEFFCNKAGFTPKVVMESDNPETIREFVMAGLGIALVPQMTWYNAFKDLAALAIGDIDCHRYLNLSWKTHGRLSLTTVLLREFIVDHFWAYVREKANSDFPM